MKTFDELSKEKQERVQKLLRTVYDDCIQEDTAVREWQLLRWRQLKLLWEGFTQIWYDATAHDWRIWDQDELDGDNTDQAYYDKPVNVLKAYLESIIAALSVSVPKIKCYPDDAQNTLDLATAKAADEIAQLIYRHNEVALLWLHMLFVEATEGLVFCHHYSKFDEEYGTYKEQQYENSVEDHDLSLCSVCGAVLDDKLATDNDSNFDSGSSNVQPEANSNITDNLEERQENKFTPDDSDAPLDSALAAGEDLCPVCMSMMQPQLIRKQFTVTRLIEEVDMPKGRICMEAYGGLYVKVPNYIKRQKDTPYLILSQEFDYSMMAEKYERIRGKKAQVVQDLRNMKGEQPGGYAVYAQWARLSPQYRGEYPVNVVTEHQAWIRPAKFNVLDDADDIKFLKTLYPDGVKIVYVNDTFACAENQCLDDHWTLSEDPLADYLHHEPSGRGLVSIQDITNDLLSLILQTIEHGISQTFADPGVLSFPDYQQTDTTPGGVFPATPKTGKSLSDGFHELRTATLSSEVMPFLQNVQSLGQLSSGALPSLFGGQLEDNETASGYSMSRAQALQRQQNKWKVFTSMWKRTFGKVIPMYISLVQEDERDVQKDKNGQFVNVLIKKADLEGKLGKVELEASENLPITWTQRRDMVKEMLASPNPQLMQILMDPENLPVLHEALGLIDFTVPGEDDVIQQWDEIRELLNSEPLPNPDFMPTGDPMMDMPEIPSVPIDPVFDNNQIGFNICRHWAISPEGRLAKLENEPGYRNVLLHGKLHYMQMQAQMLQQQAQSEEAPPEKPKETDQEAPIMGEENVATVN